MKKNHLILIAVVTAILSGCAGPKFAGLKKETIENKQIEVVSTKATNYQTLVNLLGSIQPNAQVLNYLDKDKLTIVANYSQYPFNTHKGDNPDTSISIDNNINGELSLIVEKFLIQSGYRVLENYSSYNAVLDNNYDEYQQMLVFDLKKFGLYYEHVGDDVVIRHADCNIRFKVIEKEGIIRTIADISLDKKDTLSTKDLPSINMLPVNLSYQSIQQDQHLSLVNLPALTSQQIESIYTVPPKETSNAIEKVVGLKFAVPNETKTYSILVLDNVSYSELVRSKGGNLKASDIMSLSPRNLSIKSNEREVERRSDGSKSYSYYAVLNSTDLSALFEKSKEVVLINKLKKICVLRQLSDGTIVPL